MSNSYDPIDTCPYDPVHRIMRSRMQYHLTKCSKNWPCSKKKQCPYDARHVVNQIEFNYHISICPQREFVWDYKLEENEKENDLGILPIDPSPVVAPAEDVWEEEDNVQSYDPIKYTENKLVTRILIGAPKSQRKKHRIQERLRISRLADDAPKKEKDRPATQNKNNRHAASKIKPSTKEASVEAKRVSQSLHSSKELPTDTSKTSKIATINKFNTTINSTVVHQMQNSVNPNEPLEFVQEKSNENNDLDPQTTFNYAAATKKILTNQHQRYSSIETDYDVIESKQWDTEKENNNSSFFNRNKEDLNLQTTFSYAAAAKNVLTNQRQRYSSIESDYDIESKQCDTKKENNNSFFNRNKEDLNLQTTCSYAAAAKNVLTNQRQRYSSIESDYDVIESKKYYTEKENNNSSFLNKHKEDLNMQTTCSYAAAAKNVITNQRQRYSSIESDYDVIECKQWDTEKENNNSSFLNRNKAFDLQASTFSYAAAAKNSLANQQYSYIESDFDFIESKKWDTVKEDNNSSFSNSSRDVDLPTTAISYAAAAKIVPTIQSRQNNSIESIKVDTKKDNNSSLTNRNEEIFDRQRTFNYATAATKYVAPHLRHRKNNIESDSDVVTESIKCETEKENNSLLTNRNKEDLDMQKTTFNYATDAENVPTIRRPRNSSIESDCDIICESIKYNSEKENSSSFFNRNKEYSDHQATTFNYTTDAENVPTIRRPRNSSIESDCEIISESIKCDTEKDNNSSFFSRNKVDSDMQTTFSYATAAKNLSTNQRPRNSSIESASDFVTEGIKYNTEEENNSSFVNKNKEYSDRQATTFNYAAATKYVPLSRQPKNSIESDYDLQSTKFSSATATKNVLTNQPQRKNSFECDYDTHTASLFRYTSAAKNALINRRPRINSTESDYDMVIESMNYDTEKEYNSSFFNNRVDENLVKVTKTIKSLSIGDTEHKVQSQSLGRTLGSLNRTINYSSITNHGLNRININKPLTSETKTSRCATDLHFTNLRQYLQNTK